MSGHQVPVAEPAPPAPAHETQRAGDSAASPRQRLTFAVVVTSYNYRDFVVEAVEGALGQTRAPTQVIVVDDGSTDGSAELLKERYSSDPRVTLVFAPNGGQLHGLQRGMALVDADIVCFLDSDDRWKPDYFEKIAALYEQRPDIDFVFSDMHHFDQQDRMVGLGNNAIDFGFTALTTYASTVWYGAPTSAVSMRVDWARRVLDVPDAFRPLWKTSPDNLLVYGASVLGARKYYLPTGSVDYRIHGSNAWLSNRSVVQSYRTLLKTRSLIAYYAQKAGLDDSCVSMELCKLEYRTKPRPPWIETKRYIRLVMTRRVWPPWKKWERALSILIRGLRSKP